MEEAISPYSSNEVPIENGRISVIVTIRVDETRYPKGAISVDEANRILDEIVKPEYRDRIELRV